MSKNQKYPLNFYPFFYSTAINKRLIPLLSGRTALIKILPAPLFPHLFLIKTSLPTTITSLPLAITSLPTNLTAERVEGKRFLYPVNWVESPVVTKKRVVERWQNEGNGLETLLVNLKCKRSGLRCLPKILERLPVSLKD